MKENILLDVKDLKMHFPVYKGAFGIKVGVVKAVDGVSFSVREGETFGLVGESGCGKTTVGRAVLRIYKPTAGTITYKGEDITGFTEKEMSKYRREMQMIFQDPYSSLDPRQSVGSIVREAITADKSNSLSKEDVERRVDELLQLVELDVSMKDRYPHEMSGGQRQRLGIARALACNPKLIVCDEPVSALDVSIQAQIINLFIRLQKKLGLTYVFVAHDLAVVRHISDRIAVMYLGNIVEITEAVELYDNPLHPYTKALLSAVPVTDYDVEKKRERITLQGEVPSPINAPTGCPFHPRCIYATERCKKEKPVLSQLGENHFVACHNV
jgi:oligopeptide/dipeptide ABC transporter ATP-binding protein